MDYSDEMVALLGPSAKQQLANLEALEEQPWTDDEYRTLVAVLGDAYAIPTYPGSYFIDRYANFVVNRGFSEGADAADMLQEYAPVMNKEITRKRQEFKLMVDDEWQAVRAYMEMDDFSEWREYWNETYGITDPTDNSCMQYSDEYDYSYRDWMEENGVSVSNYETWQENVAQGDTNLSYREWLEQE